MDYQPLDKASKVWDICVSFPHMKDAYWMAVDYGVVAESERLENACARAMIAAGVDAQWVEADYANIDELLLGDLGPAP